MSCTFIEGTENLLPGWGCCACRKYNGALRERCSSCGHGYCGPHYEVTSVQTLVVNKKIIGAARTASLVKETTS